MVELVLTTITTGSGSDTIVLRALNGGDTLADADTITDFTDGSDVLGLDDDLLYSELEIAQSGSDTVISIKSSSEYLAVLTGVNASNINYFDLRPWRQVIRVLQVQLVMMYL